MNTGQMMITIGAIMLLTLVILRVNNNFLSTNSVLMNSKYGILAVSLATSIIEEASSKNFDELSIAGGVFDLTGLTPANDLGPEGGEVYPNFDDFDDYNGHLFTTAGDPTFLSAVFTGHCTVEYIDTTDLEKGVNLRTWHKKITVYVTSESMKEAYEGDADPPDTLVMSSIFSYWF